MSIINSLKKTSKMIIETPIFTSFFVLFLILFNFILVYAASSKNVTVSIILSICCFLLIVAFLSGWFQLAKEATSPEQFKEKKVLPLFFEGIGKNIIPILIGTVTYSVILKLVIYLFYNFVAIKIFGNIDFIIQENLSKISQDTQSIQNFFTNLSPEQIKALLGWTISGFCILITMTFLFMFYTPAIIFNDKNNMFLKPFIAIKDSLVFTYKNFIDSLAIYAILFVIYLILEVVGMLFMNITPVALLLLLVNIYFVSFLVMLLFNYYEQQNNNSNRSDSIGENECLDTTSKEA